MNDAPTPKPGWYPDPVNSERESYWDGSKWTERAPELPPATKAKPAKGGNGRFTGCLVIFLAPIAIFIVGIIGASVVSAGQTPAQRNDDEGTAMALCQDKVKESLKSPTTAQFSRVSGVRTANLFWTVTGAVDSQNGFGAMLEDQFVCTMEVRESDGFQRTTLISLG